MNRVIPIRPAEEPEYVSLYEKREKIQPRSVRGWFANWRWVMVWITQAVFYGLPWLPWHGRQAVLFDLGARRFYLFDLILYPQDFIYLTGLLVLSAYSLFFVTAVGGRLWCGYACPQTVYTEIFMWIERRFEGDRGARIRLDNTTGWNWDKLWRRGGKHVSWLTVAGWTGFTFVGYFTPIRTLWGEAFTLAFGPWEWFWVNFYALATYGNAGFLREQVCKYMCPYARFQSAMFDRDTMIVTYDPQRGEPRGKRGRDTDLAKAGLGDCIDCGLCVQVCPTGIDIRDGLQYECIACAACIDACNGVMDKMHYSRGLIRYATENGLRDHASRTQMFRHVLRPRVLIYGTALVLIAAGVFGGLAQRQPVKVDVIRERNALARIVDNGFIENAYRLQLMNTTDQTQTYRLAVEGLPDSSLSGADRFTVGPAQARWVGVAVRIPPQVAQSEGAGAKHLRFLITPEGRNSAVIERSTFIIPR